MVVDGAVRRRVVLKVKGKGADVYLPGNVLVAARGANHPLVAVRRDEAANRTVAAAVGIAAGDGACVGHPQRPGVLLCGKRSRRRLDEAGGIHAVQAVEKHRLLGQAACAACADCVAIAMLLLLWMLGLAVETVLSEAIL